MRTFPCSALLLLASLLGAAPVLAQEVAPPAPGEATSEPASSAEPAPGVEPAPSEQPAPKEAAAEPSSTREASREEARALGYAGVRAYAAGDYPAASEQLERSFSLLPVPSLGLWSARALVKLQRLVDAEQRYREVAKMRVGTDAPAVQEAARETAKAELLDLLPRIPTLRIQIAGALPEQVEITLDGASLPIERWSRGEPVDPGIHHLVGKHLGEESAIDITASEGRVSEVMLRFAQTSPTLVAAPLALAPTAAPMSAAPPAVAVDSTPSALNPLKLSGWIAVGAGASSLALSAASYFVALDEYAEMKQNGRCDDHVCQPGPQLDRYDRWRSVHLVSLVAGGVLGATGATLLILEHRLPRQPGAAHAELGVRVGAGSAALFGRF